MAFCIHPKLQKERGFALLLFLFCFFGRLPIALSPTSLDWDEAQFIVSAWSLSEDPVFFRSTECGSSGPLNIYPLIVPAIFGFDISFLSSRLIGNFLIGLALALSFIAAIWFKIPYQIARPAFLPTATFLSLSTNPAFAQYLSEIVPTFLLACSILGISAFRFFKGGAHRSVSVLFTATALSLVPFAKLQSVPIAAALAAILLACILFDRKNGGEDSSAHCKKAALLSVLFLGGVFFPFLAVWFFYNHGVLGYFFNAYILNAIAYSSFQESQAGPLARVSLIALQPPQFAFLLCLQLIFGAITLLKAIKGRKSEFFYALIGAWVFLATSLFAVVAPNRNYEHYGFFLILPACMVFLFALQAGKDSLPDQQTKWLPFFPLGTSVILFLWLVFSPSPFLGEQARTLPKDPDTERFVELIHNVSSPEDKILLWGYAPDLYTTLNRKCATRLSTVSVLFDQSPLRGYFRKEFLQDLKRTNPELIVDVSPINRQKEATMHIQSPDSLPEFMDFIHANYSLYLSHPNVSIWRRSDRF